MGVVRERTQLYAVSPFVSRSVVLDGGAAEAALEDARRFLGSRRWYSDRGIPYRWGSLLTPEPPKRNR